MENALETVKTYIDEQDTEARNLADDAPTLISFDDLKARVETLESVISAQRIIINHLDTQVQALPTGAGTSHSRQPKIAEPPAFTGADDKVNLAEWLRLVTLWNSHEGVATDSKKIVVALSLLKGAAHKYMSSYYDKLEQGQNIGTWEDFKNELVQIYGQRDDKEGAKKELTALFNNKDLAQKNFVKYAERFRTLGRLSGYEDALLIEKLRLIIDRDMRLCLIGARNVPTKWTEYLDLLLEFYKELYPEKTQGKIFAKAGNEDSTPMEVDAAKKKKMGKGKGKEVNSTEKSKGDKQTKYCHIHKTHGHNTEECKLNPKSSNYSKPEEKKTTPKPSSSTTTAKKVKVRAQEVESSDSSSEESDTPLPPRKKSSGKKKAEANAVRVESTAYIEEVAEEDEPLQPSSSKQLVKGKPFDRKDFLKRYL
ncbi:hypothetical protein BDY19DRAFT_899625 [Irpex rosettiformis]|uniref:Uncharacterized protein n=1 Tax=Irpex rosettiformis TaxID=378272 RepID=A0ACB8TP36_9APHY|nr:hypothetical protein BDY19DRAFT_899625 [Irpex rosettiformis]